MATLARIGGEITERRRLADRDFVEERNTTRERVHEKIKDLFGGDYKFHNKI